MNIEVTAYILTQPLVAMILPYTSGDSLTTFPKDALITMLTKIPLSDHVRYYFLASTDDGKTWQSCYSLQEPTIARGE